MIPKQKVYISAPIDGRNIEERKQYFKAVAARLIDKGYMPVNPMRNGVSEKATKKEHLKADFKMLLECDRILLCEGWEESEGCQKESSVALWSGIYVLPKESVGL